MGGNLPRDPARAEDNGAWAISQSIRPTSSPPFRLFNFSASSNHSRHTMFPILQRPRLPCFMWLMYVSLQSLGLGGCTCGRIGGTVILFTRMARRWKAGRDDWNGIANSIGCSMCGHHLFPWLEGGVFRLYNIKSQRVISHWRSGTTGLFLLREEQ